MGALAGFKGRLLAGCGPLLRLYELGKKKLLRKCEYKKWVNQNALSHVLGRELATGGPCNPLCLALLIRTSC